MSTTARADRLNSAHLSLGEDTPRDPALAVDADDAGARELTEVLLRLADDGNPDMGDPL